MCALRQVATLTAGMDTDCGGFMSAKAMAPLMEDPKVKPLVETALTNLFTVQVFRPFLRLLLSSYHSITTP